jgi:hypothetical protein
LLEHRSREPGRPLLQATITQVERNASERLDSRHIENALLAVLLLGAELPLQNRGGVMKSANCQSCLPRQVSKMCSAQP